MTMPNVMTITRFLLVPIIIYLLYLPMPWAKWVSLFLFILAMLGDTIDGLIARKRKLITNFGIFLDPIVDQIIILSLFIVLGELQVIPIWVPLIIVWREFLVLGARSIASSHGQIVGANWMGITKSWIQTLTIVAGQLFLALKAENVLSGGQMVLFNVIITILWLLTLLLSIAFASIFVYWNRSLLFKDI